MFQPANKKKVAWEREQASRREQVEKCYREHAPIQVVKAPKGSVR